MSAVTEISPLNAAAGTVADLGATAAHWASEEAAARAEVAAAKARLDDGSLDDPEQAYRMVEAVAAAEERVTVAASLACAARRKLDEARMVLAREQAAEARAHATTLWMVYRTHEVRRRQLVAELAHFDGVTYVPQQPTGSDRRLAAAQAADAHACALEVEIDGESAVCRSTVPDGDGRRSVWIGVAGPPAQQPGDGLGRTRQRSFRVTVDGRPSADGRIGTHVGDAVTWIRREVPVDAVVVIEGERTHFVDDPAAGA
ncbi:hypothetical protein E4P40_25460 [Blastococcus sp. CT_GayMR20]|uniref:hypothetical protein n=1 Tax=Blastococcus sp. CT_GayMR20 TaxID=2559609 RepID=UPI001073F609|nr:hypothetical protein [Blastococcus sp. CT_GayMR20]TFV66308.1 hypothetical protein E4P40_25460 [Blastococcus sp. CT_GayMR20]